jgi:hypothetical protein
MSDFTKAKIGFAVALLVALFIVGDHSRNSDHGLFCSG